MLFFTQLFNYFNLRTLPLPQNRTKGLSSAATVHQLHVCQSRAIGGVSDVRGTPALRSRKAQTVGESRYHLYWGGGLACLLISHTATPKYGYLKFQLLYPTKTPLSSSAQPKDAIDFPRLISRGTKTCSGMYKFTHILLYMPKSICMIGKRTLFFPNGHFFELKVLL